MSKKILGIVLVVAMLCSMCVGLTLNSSADTVKLPAIGKNENEAEIEYFDEKTAQNATITGNEKITFTGNGNFGWNTGIVECPVTELNGKDYVIGFQAMLFKDDARVRTELTFGNNGTKDLKLIIGCAGSDKPNGYIGGAQTGETDAASLNYTAPKCVSDTYAVYVKANEDKTASTVYFFVNGTLKATFEEEGTITPLFKLRQSNEYCSYYMDVANTVAYEAIESTEPEGGEEGKEEGKEEGGEDAPASRIVNGVDTKLKGTAKTDVKIVSSPDKISNLKDKTNRAQTSKATATGKVSVAKDGSVTMAGGQDYTIPLNGITAETDYILQFTTKSLSWWPHEALEIILGTTADGKKIALHFTGNYQQNGPRETPCTFYIGAAVNHPDNIVNARLRVPVNTYADVEYTIYVTTSRVDGKRRIYFFANGQFFKTLVNKNDKENTWDKNIVDNNAVDWTKYAEEEKVLSGIDVFNPTFQFHQIAGSSNYVLSNLKAYIVKDPSGKEAPSDTLYKIVPIVKNAKNLANIDKAKTEGRGTCADGKIHVQGGDPQSSVTVPLTGLTKNDSYVISFMTTMCSYDDWQGLNIRVAQTGKQFHDFTLRGGESSYNQFATDSSGDRDSYRFVSVGQKGDMVKIDIFVGKSYDTGKRRYQFFMNGKAMTLRGNNAPLFDYRDLELLDPCLKFYMGTSANGAFDITDLKVYKVIGGSSSEGGSTGNPSKAGAALAVTALIALPVIFVSKKRKEEI